MLRAAFIMAALDAGVPLRDVQIAARHADPRTTTIYDHRRQNFDRHAAYVVVAFVTGGSRSAAPPTRRDGTPVDNWCMLPVCVLSLRCVLSPPLLVAVQATTTKRAAIWNRS
jgi:hypothetical protein